MSRVNEAADRSEWALRSLAALLAVLFLIGVAACGGDVPDAQATVSGETPGNAGTPAPVAKQAGVEAPGDTVDPASTPAPAPRVVSYEEAEEAYHGGAYGAAVDLFRGYTAQKPTNPWGHYMLGLSAWKAGHLDVAETALRESVDLDPNHVKGRVNLARVLLEAGGVEEALEQATIAEDIDPTSIQAKRTLARALGESGDLAGALAMYEETLSLDPEDTWSLNNMGYLLLQRGRYEEAVGPLALAAMLASDNPVFLNNLGSALEGAGHVVAAARAFEGAAGLDPEYTRAVESAARLGELVTEGDVAEVDVAALGESFRSRLVGVVDDGEAPVHGEKREPGGVSG